MSLRSVHPGGSAPAVLRVALVLLAGFASAETHLRAQATPSLTGREAVERLSFEPLEFEQPEVTRVTVGEVDVLLLEDSALPLVTVHAYFRGGYGLFDRDLYAAATGLPALMRYGGTEARAPAEIDESLEYHAFQVSFGTGGGSVTSSMNTLTRHTEVALDLWADMLTSPRFARGEVEAWRGRQLEAVLRRLDDPARLAFSEMNRLLFGDHPVGWEMDAGDLTPERLTTERLRRVHRRVVCRQNLVLGVTGAIDWDRMAPLIESLVSKIPECQDDLPDSPVPEIRRASGVYLIEKDLEQAVIVMAHPTSVTLADTPEYFSAMIGNSVLGGGGFSSRILGRVRTQEGFAYSASSLWTTPREHEGIVGATTRTRPANAVPAVEAILETMEGLREAPPTDEEVQTTVDQIVNGFVFNFDTASQIVARSMYYLAQDLPEDWLERFWRGVQAVTAQGVQSVFAEHLRPDEMTILVVGDPDRIGRSALESLGPVTVLEVR